jgi:hypothetical protein
MPAARAEEDGPVAAAAEPTHPSSLWRRGGQRTSAHGTTTHPGTVHFGGKGVGLSPGDDAVKRSLRGWRSWLRRQSLLEECLALRHGVETSGYGRCPPLGAGAPVMKP